MKTNKMKLVFIQFGVAFSEKLPNAKYFNRAGHAMGSLFIGNLRNFHTGIIFKIIIDNYTNLPKKEELTEPFPERFTSSEEVRRRIANGTYYHQNFIDYTGEVVSICRNFNFDLWFKSDKQARRKLMIEEMYYSLLHLANHFKWETQPLHDAYNACIAANFENAWYIKKFTKTSPDRKQIGKIWVEYDVDSFRTFIVITDKQENIIEKKLIHTMDYNDPDVNPLFDTDRIFKGTAKWNKNTFTLTSDKGKEIGEYSTLMISV